MDPFPSPPEALVSSRVALHRLAAYVIAPTRYAVTGRFGLRSTPGGFGTPEFEGRRVRVVVDLVDQLKQYRSLTYTSFQNITEFNSINNWRRTQPSNLTLTIS